MIYRLLLSVILICLTSSCIGLNNTASLATNFQVKIINHQGLPIAHVEAKWLNTNHHVKSDLHGDIQLTLHKDTKYLILQAAGYDIKKIHISDIKQNTIVMNHPNEQFTEKRKKELFDFNWKFNKGDGEFSTPNYNDTLWRKINLPHDFSIESDFDLQATEKHSYLPGGIGWYRKEFTLPETDKNKTIQIQFDGIYLNAKIWLNGQLIGQQREGYTSRYFDLTSHINFGEQNILAVRVNNDTSKGPNSRWYTGSGIYRHTWLIKTNKLRVKNWGTFITTPVVNKQEATVNIETTIINEHKTDQNFILKTLIKTAEGDVVATVNSSVLVNGKSSTPIKQNLAIKSPETWSIESPTLYYAQSKIIQNNELVDDYISSFGARTINFSHEKGFTLNGITTKIKGVCVHHDGGLALGAAVPEAVWERRLRKLKSIGVNAIRTAHNPMAPEYMDMLDRMGFLVMHEFTDKWEAPYNPFHIKDWQQDFAATIDQHRNHPSVIIYSVGNEHGDAGDKAVQKHLATLTDFVRKKDPSRPVTSALERGKDGNLDIRTDDLLAAAKHQDVFGMNYGEQWYSELEAKNNNLVFIGTESYRYYMSTQTKRNAFIENNQWLYYLNKPYMTGSFIWAGISYMGETDIATDLGLLDTSGFSTPSALLYESMWSDKPVVNIAVYKQDPDEHGLDTSTKKRTGIDRFPQWKYPNLVISWDHHEKESVDIVTYANTEIVELYVNDTFIGRQRTLDVPNRIMKWRNVPWYPGEVKAVGISGGKIIAEQKITSTSEPKKIHLTTDKLYLSSNQQDVAQIEVQVTDKEGNKVPHAQNLLYFSVKGKGKMLGVSNGNGSSKNMDVQLPVYEKNKEYAFEGRLLAILQANDTPGEITLTVTGKNLEPATIQIFTR